VFLGALLPEVELRLQATEDALNRAGIATHAGIAAEAEIVVALKHVGLVREQLERYTRPADPDLDDDADLGLGRIVFESTGKLREAVNEFQEFGLPERRLPASTKLGTDALDTLLGGLRGKFKKLNAGWAPLMGKNRLVGVGVGSNPGRIGGGGGGPLEPARRLLTRPKDALLDEGLGVRVGVLDTRIYSNPWYAGAWTSRVPDELKPTRATRGLPGRRLPPAAGHATFVTGIILQQAPAATVIARSVLNVQGEASSWEVAKAIVALARTRPHVLNLSFLCFTEDGEPPLALSAAIDKVDAETVIVAAAGNHGHPAKGKAHRMDPPAWPAAFDRVVAVASTDKNDEPSGFSPRGRWVDVYLPGEDVRSTFIEGRLDVSKSPDTRDAEYKGFASWSGTSFAAARLSGAIAARTKVGTKSPSTALAELLDEGRPLPGGAAHARTLGVPPLTRYFDPKS
jgi:membrane-anchored mycosin MYCP